MRRALGSLVTLFLVGCSAVRPPASTPKFDVCHASSTPILAEPSPLVPNVEPPWGARISRVEITGNTRIPRELALRTIQLRAGAPLDTDAVTRDLRALLELEAVENVSIEAERAGDDVVLRYVIQERRLVGDVTYRGHTPAGHWVPLAKGELYDAARVARMRADLERNLAASGHLHARVDPRQRAESEHVDLCFVVDAGPKFVVDRIAFSGNQQIPHRELAPLVHSHANRANATGKPYREDLLEADLMHVQALYYERGHLGVKVGPVRAMSSVDPDGKRGHVIVDIPIQEGPVYRIRKLHFAGVDPRAAAEYDARLGVKVGDVFNRTKVVSGLAEIRKVHHVELTPRTDLDPGRGEIDVVFDVKPTE